MRTALRIALPVVVILAAVAIAAVMIAARPAVETRPPESVAPVVRVITVEPTTIDVVVRSQGTVVPRTETALLPEITGRVVHVSPSLLPGGFFQAGATLVRLESRDYELAVVSARAQVAQATARLTVEEEEAAVARREWAVLGRGDPAPLVLREPQLAEARAALDAARSALERAERDLARTTIQAPFAGRARDKRVDVGQIVSPGTPLATIYGIDVAEIRLPLPDDELAFLDLPLGFRGAQAGPPVTVRATFAGQELQWRGRIIRTEGEIDFASRMVHLVAEVKDPYGRGPKSGTAPLAVGMFVRAEIAGRRLSDVFVVPRGALRGADQVLVVDDSSRVQIRRVQIVRGERDWVVIGGGLAPGERVSVSPLDVVVDGMVVRTADAERTGS
jgi:membrane fusion protein, multidrug efflux system